MITHSAVQLQLLPATDQSKDNADMRKKDGAQPCNIVSVGKRRDGGTRYWCLEHKADATAKYGRRAPLCRHAHIPPILAADTLNLNVADFAGGIALWGAVPPVYDTTRKPLERGVHVHARQKPGRTKAIDRTYRAVHLTDGARPHLGSLEISELDAIYYMVGTVFGYEAVQVICTYCGYSHLDKDWFSLHQHRRHLCAGCGRHFRDSRIGIGNPIAAVREALVAPTIRAKPSTKTINLRQADFPGGIQIWGSNPALYWTAKRPEEAGIHLHAFASIDDKYPAKDDTYGRVSVDGVLLDAKMVRTLMAQSALPHIDGRVTSFSCTKCGVQHFDDEEHAFTPSDTHICSHCHTEFTTRGRLRKLIGNPLVEVLERLGKQAPRTPQYHDIGLLPETI